MFGDSYSGLEYDYRGLIHVYTKMGMPMKVFEYNDILSRWRELRDKHAAEEVQLIDLNKGPDILEDVINTFFAMWYDERLTWMSRNELISLRQSQIQGKSITEKSYCT